MTEGTVTRSLKLPASLNRRLLYHAQRKGEYLSTIIREGIRSELARLDAEVQDDAAVAQMWGKYHR